MRMFSEVAMLLFILVGVFVSIEAQFEVPDATIEAFSPRGFRVSIPDVEGIKLFAFHGKINEEMNGREGGTFSRDITKAKNGRWTFIDTITKLNVGDIIYYWTYVDYFDGRNKLGYPKDDQMFTVTELIEKPTTPRLTPSAPVTPATTSSGDTCEPSPTVYNGKTTCKGKLIFSEVFEEFRDKFWTHEQKFGGNPDFEFVIYDKRSDTLNLEEKILTIKPILTDDVYGTKFVNTDVDFGRNCTGVHGTTECYLRSGSGYILPPVLSSQISTKHKFSFKYGKVEIKAKLPKGDWIYPELYLNSANEDYGPGYSSGQIRIAFLPGNDGLNHILHGGSILGPSTAARNYGMKTIAKQSSWSDSFHRFGVEWKPNSITVSVDDNTYGVIYPPPGGFASLGPNLQLKDVDRWRTGSALAPFDKEMYIVLGVGVGGFSFEDTSDGTKPWRNGERLSVKKFYQAQAKWKNTWNQESSLQVDHVKIWAI